MSSINRSTPTDALPQAALLDALAAHALGPQVAQTPTASRGGRPTREAAAKLGDHILATALAEYTRHGIGGVTLDEVARAAGVSKRTLYARFGDRDGLLLATIERGIERIVVPVSAVPATGTLSDRLRHISAEMVRVSLRPDTIGLEHLIASIAQRSPGIYDRVYDTVQAGRLRLFRSVLQEAAEQGEIDADRIDLAASIVFDSLVTNARRQALMHRIDGDDVAAIHRYLAAAIDMILYGVLRSPPAE